MATPAKRRESLETNISPAADAMPADDRRDDPPRTPPDSMPPRGDARIGEEPAGGGFTPREDGGNENHPIHDDDPSENAEPSDYERDMDRLDAAKR